jgi:putative phosphoribosyl transferase
MAIFADRAAAGRELAGSLTEWQGTDAVVFGIPRGGVVVAAEVARILGLELDVAVVRKLGSQSHEEYALGAIADGVRIVDPDAMRLSGVTDEQLQAVEDLERAELARRRRAFPRLPRSISGRSAIVVDDGNATGASASAACRALRAEHPDRIVLAVPVAPLAWTPDAEVADDYVCPHRISDFWAVGQFYDDFTQTEDEEVSRLLSRASTGSATEQGNGP